MAKKKKTESPSHPRGRKTDSPHPALKLRHTLQGHTDEVYRMALSPDGRTLASPSNDWTVRLWDVDSGQILKTLEHHSAVVCVGWSPDGSMLATGTAKHNDRKVYLWNLTTEQKPRILGEHGQMINAIAWSPEGKILASCSSDFTLRMWDAANGQMLQELKGHSNSVHGFAWSPDGNRLCSGSWDDTVKIWDTSAGEVIRTLQWHPYDVNCVAWSPNGHYIASGSDDKTVRIWDAETGRGQYVLEGHTAAIRSVSFLDSGRLLASLGNNGTVIFWATDTWVEVLRVKKIGETGFFSNVATHPTLPLMASHSLSRGEVKIWDIDLALLYRAEKSTRTVFYVNAKAVLLGESGVGKSGLGIRIAEREFRHTESTHGAQFWHFPTAQLPGLPTNIQAELTLWDLAGQPEYRLTHQLFLDDTDVALLLFDCSDANDPFRGVPFWAKVLKKQAPPHAKKFLVSARCDVSPVTVDRPTITGYWLLTGWMSISRLAPKSGRAWSRSLNA